MVATAGRSRHPYRSDDDAVERVLDGRELLVVSNREPYEHTYVSDGDGDADDGNGDVTVSRPAGGLTAALDPLARDVDCTWIAWGSGDADRDVVDEYDRVSVPPEDPAYEIRRVWLDDDLVSGYYYGYANQVLWPACHGMPSKLAHDDEFWRRYRDANARFVAAIEEEVTREGPSRGTTNRAGAGAEAGTGAGPIVWFQDYHLALAPRMLRRRLEDVFTLHFWHVPWPPWDVLRRIPEARSLLRGLLGNDAIAFHTDRDRRYFVRCARAALDAEYDPAAGELGLDGQSTFVRTHPLGVDAETIGEGARSRDAESFWGELAAEHGLSDVHVAVGVDRLDYTKGIVERLDAIERLLEREPGYRGEFTLVQKASESRIRIDEYREVKREVESRVEALNDRFATEEWQPVVYLEEFVPRPGLVGLYRNADVALVSSLRDGMNLVAKEFVAAQVGEPGVLVLSELTGASEELGDGALTINPVDTAAFAGAIDRALSMPSAERRRRMHDLRNRVYAADGRGWVADQFATVAAVDREEAHVGGATYAAVD